MKKLSVLLSVLAGLLVAAVLLAACEKEETPISGPSSLKVVNNCTYDVSIYFDNDFIGGVEKDASRTWSVPTGTHEVRASSYIGGVTTKNPTFIAGQTIIMTLSSGIKKSSDIMSVSMDTEIGHPLFK
ncbi:MAG: hypothetical protein RQ743_12620 [Bacteroidales bacterium]|nr:hypothetical protein [Bacteroidales bacterium]